MTDWDGNARTWPYPTPYTVTGTDLNEEVRDPLLFLYERRVPPAAALLSLLVQDTALAQPLPIDGTSLVNASATLYTVPVGKILWLQRVSLWNSSATTAFTPTVRIVESGQSPSIRHTIVGTTLYQTDDLYADGPWFLEAGDFISGDAVGAVAQDVACRFDGALLSAQIPGHTLLFDDGQLLTTSFATVVGASGTEIVLALTMVNTHSAARRIDIAIVESGGGIANAKQVFGRTVEARETVILNGPWVLETGDSIHAKGSEGTVLAIRATRLRINA